MQKKDNCKGSKKKQERILLVSPLWDYIDNDSNKETLYQVNDKGFDN